MIKYFVFFSLFLSFSCELKADDSYSQCVKRYSAKWKKLSESQRLEAIRKRCRAERLLPGATDIEYQRFNRYHLLCKYFLLRRVNELGAEAAKKKLTTCRKLAKRYAYVDQIQGSGRCLVKACDLDGEKENCRKKEFTNQNVDKEFCLEVAAPLRCMTENDVPEIASWDYQGTKGSIKCSEF